MKSFIYLAIFLFFSSCQEAPSAFFEGKIVYQYSYKSDSIPVDSLKQNRPAISDFYYKGEQYLSTFYGATTDAYIVNGQTGIAYYLSDKTDTILCENYRLPSDSVHHFKLKETNETVLGYATKILEIKGNYSTTRFWVSTDLKVNPDDYKNHQAYLWYFYLKEASGGIILKVEHIFKNFTMSGIATEITRMEVPEALFDLPKERVVVPCK